MSKEEVLTQHEKRMIELAESGTAQLSQAVALERIADALERMSTWTMTMNWTRELKD